MSTGAQKNKNQRIALLDGLRTPFCKMATDFNDINAQDLGCLTSKELIERTGIDPCSIDEVIFGNVSQPPDAANISRVIALRAGIPVTVPAYTVHRNCASGVESIVSAAQKIRLGEAQCIMSGGTESMSNIPFFLSKQMQEVLFQMSRAKTAVAKIQALLQFRLKYMKPQIGLQLGLTDPVCGLNMGQTAEVLAKEFGITRKEQDQFSLLSHQKAVKAKEILREEIVPVIPSPKYKEVIYDDNGPRENQTLEALAKLRPFFDRRSGTVTAGNSSQVTDGAVSILVASESIAQEFNIKPLGYIRSYAFAGVEPHRMGIGPAHAIPRALKNAGMKMNDVQAVEINEAFAAQVLACLRCLDSKEFASEFGYEGCTGFIDRDILNVNGGAVALGHPVGATGARLILTMLKHMQRKNLNVGMVSLCVGGGQGAAVILER